MLRRLMNLPFTVATRAAKAFQDREDAKTKAHYNTAEDPGTIEVKGSVGQSGADIDPSTITLDVLIVSAMLGQKTPMSFVDVREKPAYDAGHVVGALLMPMDQVNVRVSELPTDCVVIALCEDGKDALRATRFFRERGMEDTWVLAGGMAAWRASGAAVVKS